MSIETLLSRYFEGETTCEEERELRRYFTEEEVPEALQSYRPLFAYMAQEVNRRSLPKKRYRLSGIAAAAAVALLLVVGGGIWLTVRPHHPQNFVIIDGRQYTDISLVRAQAQAAFAQVQLSPEEVDLLTPFK